MKMAIAGTIFLSHFAKNSCRIDFCDDFFVLRERFFIIVSAVGLSAVGLSAVGLSAAGYSLLVGADNIV
jgi:hypothetical protein